MPIRKVREPSIVEVVVDSFSGFNRRKVPRRLIHGRVGILVNSEFVVLLMLEIGEGGMLLESPRELPIEGRLLVTLHIPGHPLPIFVRGRVSYRVPEKPTHYGINFENVEFTARRIIRNYVASSTTKSGAASA